MTSSAPRSSWDVVQSPELWTRQFQDAENLVVHSGGADACRATSGELRETVSGAPERSAMHHRLDPDVKRSEPLLTSTLAGLMPPCQ